MEGGREVTGSVEGRAQIIENGRTSAHTQSVRIWAAVSAPSYYTVLLLSITDGHNKRYVTACVRAISAHIFRFCVRPARLKRAGCC